MLGVSLYCPRERSQPGGNARCTNHNASCPSDAWLWGTCFQSAARPRKMSMIPHSMDQARTGQNWRIEPVVQARGSVRGRAAERKTP